MSLLAALPKNLKINTKFGKEILRLRVVDAVDVGDVLQVADALDVTKDDGDLNFALPCVRHARFAASHILAREILLDWIIAKLLRGGKKEYGFLMELKAQFDN